MHYDDILKQRLEQGENISRVINNLKNDFTVIFLNIRTPKKFVVITLKFELCGSTIE